MERLTYWNEEYGCWSYHGPSGEAAKRLAAYEDTGLEPEEIFSAVDMAEIACAPHELNVYKELGSIDCLRKLAGGPGETSTITNGGKIRAMSDEELAAVIVKAYSGGEDLSLLWCDRKGGCTGEDMEKDLVYTDERLLACVVRWLGSPTKEGKNSGY